MKGALFSCLLLNTILPWACSGMASMSIYNGSFRTDLLGYPIILFERKHLQDCLTLKLLLHLSDFDR